eukprot:4185745-Ditylum_brightwellii.AAC.1
MAKMGTEICAEMTEMITILTSGVIEKINKHMDSQYHIMSTNVSNMSKQMQQASAELMTASQTHAPP